MKGSKNLVLRVLGKGHLGSANNKLNLEDSAWDLAWLDSMRFKAKKSWLFCVVVVVVPIVVVVVVVFVVVVVVLVAVVVVVVWVVVACHSMKCCGPHCQRNV